MVGQKGMEIQLSHIFGKVYYNDNMLSGQFEKHHRTHEV